MRAVVAMLIVTAVAGADEPPRVSASALCVTKGAVTPLAESRFRIEVPKLRAVVPGSDGDRVELRFVYAGPTQVMAPLGSGELRRQIGVKLRAQDGCNVLYIMWRIEPKPELVVSVKRNPGQRTHAECANRGYRNLHATTHVPPAPIRQGSTHILVAALDKSTLRVWADGVVAWEGEVGADALALAGPAGVRSDNGRFDVELRAQRRNGGAGCVAAEEE